MILLILLGFTINDVWIIIIIIVRWKLMLVTFGTQKGLNSQQDEWSFICPSYF